MCYADNVLTEGLGNTRHTAERLTLFSSGTLRQGQNVMRSCFLNQTFTVGRDEVRKLFLLCRS